MSWRKLASKYFAIRCTIDAEDFLPSPPRPAADYASLMRPVLPDQVKHQNQLNGALRPERGEEASRTAQSRSGPPKSRSSLGASARVSLQVPSGNDETCATIVLNNEDHTIGNSLRYMIAKVVVARAADTDFSCLLAACASHRTPRPRSVAIPFLTQLKRS